MRRQKLRRRDRVTAWRVDVEPAVRSGCCVLDDSAVKATAEALAAGLPGESARQPGDRLVGAGHSRVPGAAAPSADARTPLRPRGRGSGLLRNRAAREATAISASRFATWK